MMRWAKCGPNEDRFRCAEGGGRPAWPVVPGALPEPREALQAGEDAALDTIATEADREGCMLESFPEEVGGDICGRIEAVVGLRPRRRPARLPASRPRTPADADAARRGRCGRRGER